MPWNTVRLKNEWKLLRELNDTSQLVKAIPTESVGSLPIRYSVQYYCRGLAKNHSKGTIEVNDPAVTRKPHLLRIEPTNEFPNMRPAFAVETPIFHPNINDVPPAPKENFERFPPGFVCMFRGGWPGPMVTLRYIVLLVGEMIQLKRHGLGRVNDLLPTPVCQEAARYVEKNKHAIPVDTRPLSGKVTYSTELIEILDDMASQDIIELEL